MKAALYARVSTSEKEDLQDPETQLVALRDFCKFRKLDIYHEFKEYASGTDDNRPVLRQMLDEAKKGKFDCIIVFRIDRLTRSPLKLLLILEELQDPRTKKYNVNLISATEGVDTSSRLSEGMLLMLGIFAKMERDGIEERVRSGMDRAKRYGTKSGMPIGRPRTKIPWDGIDLYIKEHTYYWGPGQHHAVSMVELSKAFGIPRSTLQREMKLRNAQNKDRLSGTVLETDARKGNDVSSNSLQTTAQKEGAVPFITKPLENEGARKDVLLSKEGGRSA